MRNEREVKQAVEPSGRVAAFFDLDGTLTELPSMERRLFAELRRCGRIAARNYFLWMAEALRLAPRGIDPMLQANKMYLRGVRNFAATGEEEELEFSWAKGREESSRALHKRVRLPGPEFFSRGVERVAWHAKQGHAIFLVSGTLEPLAQGAALALAVRLALSGIQTPVGVCATRLEEIDGRWTGRILGEAMFGEEKARAVGRIAAEQGFELQRCYAYGDSSNDRWMLAAVGRATAVNPSKELERIAGQHGWPVMRWKNVKNLTRGSQRPAGVRRKRRAWREEIRAGAK